jgi:hypothetical protein
MTPLAVARLVSVASFALAATAWADDPPTVDAAPDAGFELTWVAPADCVARPDVRELVGDARGAASVEIAPLNSQWRVTVTFTSPVEGRRTLDAGSCAEAAEAAALLLQLGARGGLAAETTPQPNAEPVLPATPAAPADAAKPPSFLAAAVVVEGQAFAQPNVDPRFGALLWWSRGLFGLTLQLSTGVRTQTHTGPSTDSGIEVYPVIDGVAGACVGASWARLHLAGCAEVEVAEWLLRGLNVALPNSGFATLVAVGATGRALFPVGQHLALIAGLSVRPLLLRPRADFQGYGAALQAGPVEGAAMLGLGARW